MKDLTSVTKTVMTEEEKAELERAMNAGSETATPVAATQHVEHPAPHAKHPATASSGEPSGSNSTTGDTRPPASDAPPAADAPLMPPKSPEPGGNAGSGASTPTGRSGKKPKLTPEQRAELEKLDRERRAALETRVHALTDKLLERLRPFVDHTEAGELAAFEARIRREAEDLKLESFGVEVHA